MRCSECGEALGGVACLDNHPRRKPSFRADKNGGATMDRLTKREHFAAMAMTSLISDVDDLQDFLNRSDCAELAVKCADALLLALEGGK